IAELAGEALLLEPESALFRPGMTGGGVPFARPEADSVGAFGVDVEGEGDVVPGERPGEEEAVLDGDGAVLGRVEEEGGRRLLRHLELVRETADQLRGGIVPQEVPPRARVRLLTQGDDRVAKDSQVGA